MVEGLPTARADVSEEKRGPRVGAPDQAVQGFLKGAGLASLDQAEKRDTGKGEFWFAVLKKKGGPTAEALPGIIDAAMTALPWPKSMRWGSGTMTWVRPLQSHRRPVRRQGAAGRGGAGRADGADQVRRHDARAIAS